LTVLFNKHLELALKSINHKAIIVRHPLERLITAYRKNFAGYHDAKSGKDVPAKASFPEFVDIVNHGYTQLAEFIDANAAHGVPGD